MVKDKCFNVFVSEAPRQSDSCEQHGTHSLSKVIYSACHLIRRKTSLFLHRNRCVF